MIPSHSLIQVYDGPCLPDLVAHLAGERLYKLAESDAPSVAYNLAGMLYLSKSGWLLLSVPNAFIRGVFAAMHEPGIELPPNEHGKIFNAHISVMSKEEVDKIGPEKIKERGKLYTYSLGRLKSVEPAGWPDISRVWFITVHSPDLQELRRSHGLSSLPRDGEFDFHVTVCVRRKGVTGRNDKQVKR